MNKGKAERPRRPRTILPRSERERQILEAATRVFALKGYRHASVTDIVEESGVARGTFYHYFESKKDIFLRLVDHYFQRIKEIMDLARTRLREGVESGEPPLHLWYLQALDYLLFHRENPELSILVLREAMGMDPQFAERVAALSRTVREYLAEELRLMHHRGMIADVDFDQTAVFIMGAAVSAVLNKVLPDPDCDLESVALELVRNQSRALAPFQTPLDRALQALESSLRERPRVAG